MARRRPRPRRRLLALAAAVALAAAFVPAASGRAAPLSTVACGAQAQATIATADTQIAAAVYANEVHGSEVSWDRGHVTHAADLLRGVAHDDPAAALAAAKRIVFHPHWHIVRLRALDARGRLLADIGGAWVLAPVRGALRLHGRAVGSFEMTVQDDAGIATLDARFIGEPVGVYVKGLLIAGIPAGTLPPGEPTGPVSINGGRHLLAANTFAAYPSGSVRTIVFVPPASSAQRRESCDAVRAGAFGTVAERLATIATGLIGDYGNYAATVAEFTGADVFVRSRSRQLATTAGAGPAALPQQGPLSYDGARWLVFSFTPRPPARVYLLVPAH